MADFKVAGSAALLQEDRQPDRQGGQGQHDKNTEPDLHQKKYASLSELYQSLGVTMNEGRSGISLSVYPR